MPDRDTSLFYEDLEVGMVLTSLGRTVTETDLVNFCMLSGDWNPIHSDEEFSRASHFGRRVVHGVFGIALVTGLMDRAGWFATSAIAMLGLEDWQFPQPIFVGDTLHCRLEVTDLRLASTGDRAVVGRRFELVNQHGDVVQEGRMPMLVRRRGGQA